jgi:arylsulfatase A-like enzyme
VKSLRRALLAGLAFGLAVGIVDLSFGTWNFVEKNLPAFTGTVIRSSLLHLALGAALGVLTAPLARRPLVHLAVMTLLWLVIAWRVAVDPAIVPMWASPAVLGAVLVLIGRVFVRPAVPLTIGAVALAALCSGPMLWQATHDADLARHDRPAPRLLAEGEKTRPDVVVIVLDTVRATSMSAYGYGLPTTPVFDDLAKDGALFLDASSPATWSLPSHATLFTGVYPSVHNAHDEHSVLTGERPTLASVLAASGYQTVAFTANPWISDHLGLTRGFDWSDEAWRDGGGGRAFFFAFRLLDRLGFGADDKGGGEVASHFEDWAASRPANAQPAFAFLNFLEAHFPHHQLPKEFLRRFSTQSEAELAEYSRRLFAAQFGHPLSEIETAETMKPAREMYDAGVAYTDHLLGRVVEALRKRGSLDRTLFVVLADHGEQLGEHGEFGHGLAVFQSTMRVPLLVRLPGTVKAARATTPVSTAAAFATVLDALDIDADVPGIVPSLLPVLDGRPVGAPILCERFGGRGEENGRTHPLLKGDVRLRAYRSEGWKLIETSKGEHFLFDLPNDPEEERDLAKEKPQELARLEGELDTWRAAMGIPELGAPVGSAASATDGLDDEAKERLRALGYVE